MLNLKIIIGGTRPGRAADLVAPWITQAAREHGGGAEAGPAGRAAAAGDHRHAAGGARS